MPEYRWISYNLENPLPRRKRSAFAEPPMASFFLPSFSSYRCSPSTFCDCWSKRLHMCICMPPCYAGMCKCVTKLWVPVQKRWRHIDAHVTQAVVLPKDSVSLGLLCLTCAKLVQEIGAFGGLASPVQLKTGHFCATDAHLLHTT